MNVQTLKNLNEFHMDNTIFYFFYLLGFFNVNVGHLDQSDPNRLRIVFLGSLLVDLAFTLSGRLATLTMLVLRFLSIFRTTNFATSIYSIFHRSQIVQGVASMRQDQVYDVLGQCKFALVG